LRRLDELRALAVHDPVLDAGLCQCRAWLLAMACRFDEAEAHLAASEPILDGADQSVLSLNSRVFVARTKELAGDVAGAKEHILATFLRMRDARGAGSEARALKGAADLALLCCDQDEWDEAAEYLAYGEEVDQSEPPRGKLYAILRLAARGRVAARRGETAEALELVSRALELAEPDVWLEGSARTWLALAEVQRAGGDPAKAEAAVAEAIRLYEAKGNVAAIARLRVRGIAPIAD
jgi:tetratricopeptide (TPR) repeat protein